MGTKLSKRSKLKKGDSAASVLTVEDNVDDIDDEEFEKLPVATPVPSTPISVRLSIKDHTPLENVELLRSVNPNVNEVEFRSNLSTIRTLYDWDTIPLDFFVDGYVGGEKTRRSLNARSMSRSRAKSESRINEVVTPPALPPRKAHRNSVTGNAPSSAVPPSPVLTPANVSSKPIMQAREESSEDTVMRSRSKTIASTTIKREVKPSDIVTLDIMYTSVGRVLA